VPIVQKGDAVFDRLKRLGQSVRRTRDAVFSQVADLFDRREVDESLWEELEELLIQADVGVPTTEHILAETQELVRRRRIKEGADAREAFKDVLVGVLTDTEGPTELSLPDGGLTTVLVVGVNGVGKTTSIAKLANYWKSQGRRCLIAAGDTFRAAAIDQLKIWGDRAGVSVVSHQPGADPGAVVFDAWQAAQARNADVLIVDTAGRLHTKVNLMEELRKIARVLSKQHPDAPEVTLLVLDATTGQNALTQAREFQKATRLTGLVLAKIDGTAKGGSVFPIVRELKVPILFLGSGEKIDDLDPFDPRAFVDALLQTR
jgi:fused signal recognition particle receptor